MNKMVARASMFIRNPLTVFYEWRKRVQNIATHMTKNEPKFTSVKMVLTPKCQYCGSNMEPMNTRRFREGPTEMLAILTQFLGFSLIGSSIFGFFSESICFKILSCVGFLYGMAILIQSDMALRTSRKKSIWICSNCGAYYHSLEV